MFGGVLGTFGLGSLELGAIAQSSTEPGITSFTASPSSLPFVGGSTVLTAVFTNGTGSVDQGVGSVPSGSGVTVYLTKTTVYTLTVIGVNGEVLSSPTTVTVAAGDPGCHQRRARTHAGFTWAPLSDCPPTVV